MGEKRCIYKLKEQEYGLPNEIIIEITNRCNLDCDFCFNKQKTDNFREISKKDIFKILEDASNSGIKAVRFSGGEPFLREDLVEILKKAKSSGIYVILNTNAFLINKKNKDYFNYVDLVLLSLHYPDSFKNVKEKMILLKDYNLKIMITTITTHSNIRHLEMFYQFVSGIKQSNFAEWFLLRQAPNKLNKKPLCKEDIGMLYEKVINYNKKHNLDIKIANALPFCAIKENLASICKGGHFDSGYTRLVIDCNGDYKTDYFSAPLGNIKNKKIMDVWNSKKLKAIRDYEDVAEKCKKCYHLRECKGGLVGKENLCNFDNVGCLASVIIPAFNDSKRVSLLIKSLENQTCNNFEIIVIDDGGTDDTKKVIKHLKNKSNLKIRYFYLDNANIFGAGIARNYGAKQAKGNVLIFMDQDTVAHQKLVENHLKQQKDKDVVLGYIAGYGNEKYRYDLKKLRDDVYQRETTKTIISDFRKNIFDKAQPYENDAWKFFCSGNFSIKKDLFLKFQFDEKIIKWGGQDIDLGYRLIKERHMPYFLKSCLAYSSSDSQMLNRSKFISCMHVLTYIFSKYEDEELKKYCFERFYHTPLNIRSDSELLNLGDRLIFKEPNKYAFVRIDDVYKKDKNLLNILNFTIKHSIPVNLQIVPNLLKKELVNFLKELKQKYPAMISINMHGFRHNNYNPQKLPKYEFGSSRDYEQQKKDILDGKKTLERAFGEHFTKIFTPPFYGYDKNTLKILSELNFSAISLKEDIVFNNNELINMPCNLDLIKHYNPDMFFNKKELLNQMQTIYDNKEALGIVLHPERMGSGEVEKFKEAIRFAETKGHIFSSIENIKENLFIKKNRIYVDKYNQTSIELANNLDALNKEIKNLPGLTNQITFNLRVLKTINDTAFPKFRKSFLDIIKFSRDSEIKINFDNIRLQSIKYDRFLIGPKKLLIDVYDDCNYKCEFCFKHSKLIREKNKEKLYAPIEFGKVKGIIEDAYAMGVEFLRICGDGDPLLHRDIRKMIEYAASLKFKIKILTNLSQGDFLLELDEDIPLDLLINLAATSPEKYKAIHNGDPKNFTPLLTLIKKLNKKYPIALSYIIFNQNYKDIEKYLRLAHSLGVKNVEFKHPTTYHEEMKSLLLTEAQRNELSKELNSLNEFAKLNGIKTNLGIIKEIMQNKGFIRNCNILEHTPNSNRCYNPWFFSKIVTSGEVYMCCRETMVIGHLSDENSFKEIFFSAESQKRGLEGKKGIDINKKEWKKCGFCMEFPLNKQVDEAILA